MDFRISNNQGFRQWCKENTIKILVIFIIYQIGVMSVAIVNYPYIDDAERRISGSTGFGFHYSRWGAEYISRIVQGSRHLTDMGLTTHFLTGIILAITSTIIIYCLSKNFSMLTAIASTMLGLNPWFLECISFRFDSPYMALSILFSVIPFLYWQRDSYIFFGISVISIFMVFNTYQSSSGIYILMLLALTFVSIEDNVKIKKIVTMFFISIVSYLFALVFYMIEMKFNPGLSNRGDNTQIAKLSDLMSTIIRNVSMYFESILERSAKVWVLLVTLIIIVFIINYVIQTKLSKLKAIFIAVTYVLVSFIASFGVYIAFTADLANRSPRYSYGFAVFFVILIILLLRNIASIILRIPSYVIVSFLCYYILTFTFVYSASLYYQKEAFIMQSSILIEDLKDLTDENITEIFSDELFKDSPVVINTARNYPILTKLVPSAESLYWPNQRLFNTYTGVKLELKLYDPSLQKFTEDELVVDNIYREIYKKDTRLFIVTK